MCDSGRHSHPLYLLQYSRYVCVCVFMWVHVGTWYLEGAACSSAQAGGPSRPVCVDCLVCEFFRGAAEGGHTVVMPAWLMARYLSVYQSGQDHSLVQRLFGVAFKRAAGFDTQWLLNIFIHSSRDISFHMSKKHASLCTSTPVMPLICGLITSRWCAVNRTHFLNSGRGSLCRLQFSFRLHGGSRFPGRTLWNRPASWTRVYSLCDC